MASKWTRRSQSHYDWINYKMTYLTEKDERIWLAWEESSCIFVQSKQGQPIETHTNVEYEGVMKLFFFTLSEIKFLHYNLINLLSHLFIGI